MAQSVFMTGVVGVACPCRAGRRDPRRRVAFRTMFAVTLSSVRLMPMVVAIVPELRGSRTPCWVVTGCRTSSWCNSWVVADDESKNVPLNRAPATISASARRRARQHAHRGRSISSPNLPVVVSAALLLLTPMYFLSSLWAPHANGRPTRRWSSGWCSDRSSTCSAPESTLSRPAILGGHGRYGLHRLLGGKSDDDLRRDRRRWSAVLLDSGRRPGWPMLRCGLRVHRQPVGRGFRGACPGARSRDGAGGRRHRGSGG